MKKIMRKAGTLFLFVFLLAFCAYVIMPSIPLIRSAAYADQRPLTVETEDGATFATRVYKLKVQNGSLTKESEGIVKVDMATPSSGNGNLTYQPIQLSNGTSFVSNSNLYYAPSTGITTMLAGANITGSSYFRSNTFLFLDNCGIELGTDREVYLGVADPNEAGVQDYMIMRSNKYNEAGYNITGAMLFTPKNLAGSTFFNGYESQNFVLINDEGADSTDFVGVSIGQRKTNDVSVTNYFDFFSFANSTTGTVNATTTEIVPTFRIGPNGNATLATGLSDGSVIVEKDLDIKEDVVVGGTLTGYATYYTIDAGDVTAGFMPTSASANGIEQSLMWQIGSQPLAKYYTMGTAVANTVATPCIISYVPRADEPQAITTADETYDIVPTSSYVELTCTNATNTTFTVNATTAYNGMSIKIKNIAANVCVFEDTPGTLNLNSNAELTGNSTLAITYQSAGGWSEDYRSINE